MATKPTRIHAAIIERLIAEHKATWGHEWPHGRRYVEELYLEAKADLGIPQRSKERPQEVAQQAKILMRETHHFPDHPAPFGTKHAN